MADFNVCPSGHKFPYWWGDPTLCLFCDYTGGLRELRRRAGLSPANTMEEMRGKELPRPAEASAEGSGHLQGPQGTQQAPEAAKTCNACNKPHSNRGGVCNACRQAAYRERKQ